MATSVSIDIGSPDTPLDGRHEINIQDSSAFPNDRVLGSQQGSTINLKNTLTEPQFNRTSAHEFGHAAGLSHMTGGLMLQSRISNSLKISKTQIDIIHINNQ